MEFLQPVRYIPGSNEAEFCGPQTFEDNKSERQGRAVIAYSKVYGVAKMISEILKAFGSEVSGNTEEQLHFKRTSG